MASLEESAQRTPPTRGASGYARSSPAVLCVDLDGTLALTDTLFENLACLLRVKPFHVLLIPFWLLRGRGYLKRRIASYVLPDVRVLPYNQALLEFLEENKLGRRVVLATAADVRIAQAVATHLNCFQHVIASDGNRNLSGGEKLIALRECLGSAEFAYVGDSVKDLPIWKESGQALTAGSCRKAQRKLGKTGITAIHIGEQHNWSWRDVAHGLRIHQWLKNTLVFVPLIASHQFDQPVLLASALLALFSFSLCASGVYLLNDVLDLESDRRHPKKRFRPFAAGRIPLALAIAAAPALIISGLALGTFLQSLFLLVLAVYLVLSSLYSFWAKSVPILDVLILAGLYTLRIYSGGAATQITISHWLLGFSIFTFLSLALLKRYCELSNPGAPVNARRGYVSDDAGLLLAFGVASAYTAALVLALYISGSDVYALYRAPAYLWALCPIYIYWISRTWLLAKRGLVHEDPVVLTLKDRTTWLLGIASLVPFILASAGPTLD